MQVDLSRNFYELFGLPLQFAVDETVLIARYQELQKQLHPDKFTSKPAAERRWSMQAASYVNDGYQTLKHELKRAVYLLKLNDISVDEETDTQMAPEFLMEQMEYREALELAEGAADPLEKLDAVRRQLKSGVREQSDTFERAASEGSWIQARATVRQWQFLDKLSREVKSMEERLDN